MRLVEEGAPVKGRVFEHSMLWHAISFQQLQIVKILIQKGALEGLKEGKWTNLYLLCLIAGVPQFAKELMNNLCNK